MRYIKIEEIRGGFSLDPTAYLDILPSILPYLPAGAQAFVSDPAHFDLFSDRFVKDLKPQTFLKTALEGDVSGELYLAPYQFRHDQALILRYSGLRKISAQTRDGRPVSDLKDLRDLAYLQLDEVLPVDGGCSHELSFTNGRMLVLCRDFTATWEPHDG